MSSSSTDLLAELAILLGEGRLRVGDETHASVSAWSPAAIKARQAGHSSPPLLAIAEPETIEEVATLVTWANRTGVCLLPYGGGSSTVNSNETLPERKTILVSLSRLNAIVWEENSLTVTAGAGVVLADLEGRLNAHDYTLGSLPRSARIATVGGAIATEAYGLFAAGYGGQREATVSVEAVLPSGEIIRTTANGAAGRTLHHLLIGSEGAFGIVTSATFAMYSLPEVRAWCAFTFDRWSDAADALRLIYRSDARPAALRLLDNEAAKSTFGITSAESVLLLGFEGSELVQTGQYQTAYAICQQIGGNASSTIDGDTWFDRERFRTDSFAANGRNGGLADTLSLYTSWSTLAAVRSALLDALHAIGLQTSTEIGYAHPHGAALDISWEAEASSADTALPLYRQVIHSAETAVRGYEGVHIAHHYGIGSSRATWANNERGSAQVVALQAIKAVLDPNRIFPTIR